MCRRPPRFFSVEHNIYWGQVNGSRRGKYRYSHNAAQYRRDDALDKAFNTFFVHLNYCLSLFVFCFRNISG
jgi:hypothetical protein